MSIDRELEMILYSTPESDVTVSAIIKDETLWLNQKSLAELFNVDISTINQHLKYIFETLELEQNSTIGKFPIVQTEG
ncbi:MAG: cell filamentation protein Fic, partial [Clostridia bacterium]